MRHRCVDRSCIPQDRLSPPSKPLWDRRHASQSKEVTGMQPAQLAARENPSTNSSGPVCRCRTSRPLMRSMNVLSSPFASRSSQVAHRPVQIPYSVVRNVSGCSGLPGAAGIAANFGFDRQGSRHGRAARMRLRLRIPPSGPQLSALRLSPAPAYRPLV